MAFLLDHQNTETWVIRCQDQFYVTFLVVMYRIGYKGDWPLGGRLGEIRLYSIGKSTLYVCYHYNFNLN